MGRLICCLVLPAVCAACTWASPPTASTDPSSARPAVVQWGPPSSYGGDGGAGAGGM